MKAKTGKWKEKLRAGREKFSVFMAGVFSSPKKTFQFLALFVFTLLFLVQLLVILISNGFYNGASDDVCQYYPIMNDFIAQIKNGTLSGFNLNNYFGASFFSDVYYVPLDIFTFISFLLSYLMPFEIAYSSTELIKLFAGVMIFAYYLYTQGMKNRTIFWMGIIYMVSGGSACYMAFPVFFSLVFYLPASLFVIHLFHQKKGWIVPLFVMALVFYNFYCAYMALAFMSILYIIETIKQPGFRLGNFLMRGMAFLGLILLGVVMAGVVLFPTIQFIIEDTYRGTETFIPWVVNIGSWELELFKPEIYIRILAKTFTEQRSVGFLGFLGDYKYEHTSLYITVIGLVFMNYIWFMRDRVSWLYKITILLGTIMMIFPFFSYLFSGTDFVVALITRIETSFGIPYTRWIDMLPLVEVLILAHVFDQHGFEGMKMKWLTIPAVVMLAVDLWLFKYYYDQLTSDQVFSAKDALIAEAVFLGIAALYLILVLVFGWLKKMKWLRIVFWVEFGVAIGYIYGASFYLVDRIDMFDNMQSIDVFLNENLDQDEFYRVYVDVDRFDVQDENFNRMTTFYTNTTKIFHSWTDAETNKIGSLLFSRDEAQEKKVMFLYSLYLNHALGYRYVLLNAEYEYNLPSNFYTLIASDEQYVLYETKDSEPFQVYESYFTYDEFQTFANTVSRRFVAQKLLLMNVLIDADKNDETLLNLENGVPLANLSLKDVASYQIVSIATEVQRAGLTDQTVRPFFRYDETDMNINFSAGAIYIKNPMMSVDGYGEVFMEFADGSTGACTLSENTTHQVKCEFSQEPGAIYFEKTADFASALALTYRMEAAINRAAYLIYDLSKEDFSNSQGMLFFSYNQTLERVFVEDEFGNQSECIKGYCFFENPPVRAYLFKTNEMYALTNLYASTLRYGYDNLEMYEEYADSDLAANEKLTIENGVITLSYTRTSSSSRNQIVMIPVTYSEEWVITSPIQYQTLSVSGGFLGIVIPEGTTAVSVTLKFVPKGLQNGAMVSLCGLGGYIVIFLPIYLFRRSRKKHLKSPVEVTVHE